MRKFWVLILLFFLVPFTLRATEVMTNDGQKFEGKILEEEDDFVLMEIENHVQVKIDRAQIVYIQKEDETDKHKKEYPLLGIAYGDPALFNLVLGYYWQDVAIKISGGYTGTPWGIQLNLSKRLVAENPPFTNSMVNFSLVGGVAGIRGATQSTRWSSTDSNGSWFYGGIGLDLSYGDVFFEVDSVAGNFPTSVTFPFQLGFIHRFN